MMQMMRHGTMYKQGDIVLIPVPFTDLSLNKKRPVLVLSNANYNLKSMDIVVVAITSNISEKEYSVLFANNDMIDGSIKLTSCIRADKIYTLSKAIVIKKIGAVKTQVIDNVIEKIMQWLSNT